MCAAASAKPFAALHGFKQKTRRANVQKLFGHRDITRGSAVRVRRRRADIRKHSRVIRIARPTSQIVSRPDQHFLIVLIFTCQRNVRRKRVRLDRLASCRQISAMQRQNALRLSQAQAFYGFTPLRSVRRAPCPSRRQKAKRPAPTARAHALNLCIPYSLSICVSRESIWQCRRIAWRPSRSSPRRSFCIVRREHRAADNHRHMQPVFMQARNRLFHAGHGRRHQRRKADDLRAVLPNCLDHALHRHVAPQINDAKAVVFQHGSDDVLPDIVNVAFHRSQHNRAFFLARRAAFAR